MLQNSYGLIAWSFISVIRMFSDQPFFQHFPVFYCWLIYCLRGNNSLHYSHPVIGSQAVSWGARGSASDSRSSLLYMADQLYATTNAFSSAISLKCHYFLFKYKHWKQLTYSQFWPDSLNWQAQGTLPLWEKKFMSFFICSFPL